MTKRCSDDKALADLALPVLESRRSAIRPSKAGKWRALALVTVHALIAVHVAHWMSGGRTMTPLEPSEAMEFSKNGLVNAGLIFFALMIGSTLVFGRWFCGWACHVVALQDLCRWMLVKVGIRPRMVNLGILGTVPWLAFAYMFLAPLLQRVLLGNDISVSGVQLVKSDFWRTFPNWPTAVVTFVVCGFAVVYFLGSKGFCNYGCPYGAIFGVADQLAPMRIRVTDACEGCGHCTAVCTSNVRVHQEVRDYGAVVDPGCMKCLDCVSVCPKDALYVGFGAPALLTRPRAGAKVVESAARPPPVRETIATWSLLAAFFVGAFVMFLAFDADLSQVKDPWRLVAALTLLSLAVAFAFQGKAQRAKEYSLAEQVLLAGVFLLAMLCFRGAALVPLGALTISVPFLFALGLSAILAYAVVQALRLLYRANVSIQNWTLRASKRTTQAGVVFAIALVPIGFVWARAGNEKRREHDARLAQVAFAEGVRAYGEDRIAEALVDFQRAVDLDPGFLEARENLAGMLCAAGRYREGIAQYEIALRSHPDDPDTHTFMARAFRALGDETSAKAHEDEARRLAPAGGH